VPAIFALISSVAPAAFKFLSTPNGPSDTQIAAAAQAQHDAEMRATVIGGMLFGGAVLLYMSRR
jgi:hypothetical protein